MLAARLGGVLAAEHRLSAVAAGVAYWTGDRMILDAAISCFEVLEVVPMAVKPLKNLLRRRGIGRLEIKKRGVQLDPAALRQQLDLRGDEEASLFVLRIARRPTAILAPRDVKRPGDCCWHSCHSGQHRVIQARHASVDCRIGLVRDERRNYHSRPYLIARRASRVRGAGEANA